MFFVEMFYTEHTDQTSFPCKILHDEKALEHVFWSWGEGGMRTKQGPRVTKSEYSSQMRTTKNEAVFHVEGSPISPVCYEEETPVQGRIQQQQQPS